MPDRHAFLGPSSAERWLNCPPSARLTEGMDDTVSEYAAAGRVAHAIAELKLRKHYLEPMGARTYKKRLGELQADEHYEPGMMSATEEYFTFVDEAYIGFSNPPYIATEQEVDLSDYVPESFGTADCIIIGDGVLHLIDYKNGAGVPVDAEGNAQLRLYALGALTRYKAIYDNIKTVRMSIVQPHAGGAKTAEMAADELQAWGMTIKPVAEMAFTGGGAQTPGAWCQFCKLKGNCSARGMFLALEAFSDRPAATYSDTEIGDILARAKGLAAWVKDLEDYALTSELAGRDIPGWKAVEGRSIRQFDDAAAAFASIVAAGTDEALLYERKPLTLAAVEKLLGKKVFAEVAGAHIVTPPGKPTLVPDSDKRAAINAAELAFGGGDDG